MLAEAEMIVTCGSSQSNFVRQLGAACSVLGIRCVAAVMDLPFDRAFGMPPGGLGGSSGNVLLDRLLGVDLRRFENGSWEELFQHSSRLAAEYRAEGLRVHEIPIGGSSALGAYAFMMAGEEIETDGRFDFIVCPTSSGSTQTGLAYAFHGSPTRVVGIACDPEEDLLDDIERLGIELDELTGFDRKLAGKYLDLRRDFVGDGYGVPSEAGNRATKLLARKEGIFLDPIYTAKAFAGLLELAKTKEIRGRILFWHTGGLPAIFAHQ